MTKEKPPSFVILLMSLGITNPYFSNSFYSTTNLQRKRKYKTFTWRMTILKRWKQIKYLGKNKPPTGSQNRLQRAAWLLVITRWTRVQVDTLDTCEQGHTGRQTHVNSGTQEDICMKTDTCALRHAWQRTLTKTDTCEDRHVSCPCSIKFSDSNILHKPHSFPGLTFVSSWGASLLRGMLMGQVLESDTAWAAHLGAQTSAGLLLSAL